MNEKDVVAIISDHNARWSRRTAEMEELVKLYDQPWNPTLMRTPGPADWVSNVHGTIYPRHLGVVAQNVLRDVEGKVSPDPVAYESCGAQLLNKHKAAMDRASRLALVLGGAGIRWGWDNSGSTPFDRLAPQILGPMSIILDDAPVERYRGARYQVSWEWMEKTFGILETKGKRKRMLPWVWEIWDFEEDTVWYSPNNNLSPNSVIDLRSTDIQVGSDEKPRKVTWSRIPLRSSSGEPVSPISVLFYDESIDDPRNPISPLGRRLDIFRAKNSNLIMAKERAETDVDTYVLDPDVAADQDFMAGLANPVPRQGIILPRAVQGRPMTELIQIMEKRAYSQANKEFMEIIDQELAATNSSVGAAVMGMQTGVTATEIGIVDEYTKQGLSRFRMKFHDFMAENVVITSRMAAILAGDLPWIVPTPEGAKPYTGAYLNLDWNPIVTDTGVTSGTQLEQRREWPGQLQVLASLGIFEPKSLAEETLRRFGLDPARFPLAKAAEAPSPSEAPAMNSPEVVEVDPNA
jgi:hypothetical protein